MPEAEGDLSQTLDRVVRLVTRRRWWVLLTASVTTLATVFVVLRLPNRYTSEATIFVVQQQVPERYVVPTSSTDISQGLEAMTQEVLARARLLQIMDEFGLYLKEKNRLAPEDLIEVMRRATSITPLENSSGRRDINAFKISFVADDPHLAQAVASRLTSLFIQANLKTREDQATTTTKFLREQLEAAKNKLTEQEQRLRDFKMQHLGELPEQQQGNLGILTGLQTQLQNTMASLNRAQQQRVYLESLLSGYRTLATRGAPVPGSPGVSRIVSPLEAAQSDLARLQSERATLLRRYTPQHPDVVKIEREIAKADGLVERLKANTPKSEKAEGPAVPSGGSEDEPAIAQIKSQLEANRLEIENLSKDEKQLRAGIGQYQSRLNLTPVREQQLAGILSDLNLLRQNYADLLGKEQQAQLATSLEKQQVGQQFRLIDPPSLPTVPTSPKRVKISLGGAAAGILLGLALAFLADVRDHCFHSEKNVSQHFALPLVVGIPLLLTAAEKRVRACKGALEWFAGSVLVVAVFVAEFYVYRHG